MKQKTIYIAILALFVSTLVYAETGVNVSATAQATTTRLQERRELNADIKANIQAEREDIKNTRTEARVEIRNDQREIIRQRLSRQYNVVAIRYQATIERLQTIVARLDSRILKIKNAGGNTTASETFSAQAKTDITKAHTDLSSFMALASTTASVQADASTTPETLKTKLTALKTASLLVQKDLNTVRNDIAKSISELKGLKVEIQASSTTSTN